MSEGRRPRAGCRAARRRRMCIGVRMRIHTLERQQFLPMPVGAVFAFFADAHNLERITPGLLCFEVVTSGPIDMGVGTQIEYRLRLHGVRLRWLTRIEAWEPGVRFVDSQIAGPFCLWRHIHSFEQRRGGTLMRDVVRYALPAWPLGELAEPLVRRDLVRIFDHRHDAVAQLAAS
jgi:ligand-binding SRPBCC domain-containing protein